jgi:hypothetical protein
MNEGAHLLVRAAGVGEKLPVARKRVADELVV